MAQIHLVVPEEQKESWEQHSENPEYDSLSQMIRLSVEQQIQRDKSSSTENTQNQEITETRNEILAEIEELDRKLRAIDNSQVSETDFDDKMRAVREAIITSIEADTQMVRDDLEDIVKGSEMDIKQHMEEIND